MTATRTLILAALVCAAAACSPPAADAPGTELAANLPPDIVAAVHAALPDLTITSGALEDTPGGEWEVTGTLPNGQETELDLVQIGETWTVVEIQRDVSWAEAPEPVRAAAAAAPNAFEPARVIESKQTSDGSVVYELFAPGSPDAAALEVRWKNDVASILAEPNPY